MVSKCLTENFSAGAHCPVAGPSQGVRLAFNLPGSSFSDPYLVLRIKPRCLPPVTRNGSDSGSSKLDHKKLRVALAIAKYGGAKAGRKL